MNTQQQQHLEQQANAIEATLTRFGAPAQVIGGKVTPRVVQFHLVPQNGTRVRTLRNLAEEIALALGVSRCDIAQQGAVVCATIPLNRGDVTVSLPAFIQEHPNDVPPLTAVLGVAEDGYPLLIRLPSPDVAHILVAGTTGSGKSALLRTVALSLAVYNAPRELALCLIDPKGIAFKPLASLPHLPRPMAVQVQDALDLLHGLVALMERRRRAHPRVVLFIDELADLVMTGGKQAQVAVTRLTQRGREVGIHVVAATQKPAAAALGPLMKANFPVRLVGKVASRSDARVASGRYDTAAERLTGRGDFVAVAEGKVKRFQAAYAGEEAVQHIRRAVARRWGRGDSQAPGRGPIPTSSVTIPAPAIAVDPDLHLARRLVRAPLWRTRHGEEEGSYRWGFLTEASKLLFGRPLEGTWDRRTRQVVALAERMSAKKSTKKTTTTAQGAPTGPLGGKVEVVEIESRQ